MCGIAGFVQRSGEAAPFRATLEKMCGTLKHRGPDGEGLWFRGPAALGHRRLSIIDLEGGSQPMATEDGSLCVVFNGEIYNFPELRAELEGKGYSFRTRSDTEVLLHGYRAYGTGLLERLNGMFAFALWDDRNQRLFAARDRLGKKPFYFHNGPDRFLFGSELKSLLADPSVPRDLDPAGIDDFFSFSYIPAPGTALKGIAKLRPGHFLIWEGGEPKISRYWDVRYRPDPDCKTEEDYVDKLEGLLTAAVKRRLISDVPLGAFLSGGLDSSVVVGLMARVSKEPVRTFTIGFEESGFSEVEDAAVVARAFGTRHQVDMVRPDALSILPDLAWHFDEPFGDSSAVPTYLVSQAARRHVTVILSGDGGDELFAGYNSYTWHQAYARYYALPRALRKGVLGTLGNALPWDAPGRNFLLRLARLEEYDKGNVAEMFPPVKAALYTGDWKRRVGARDPGEAFAYWDGPEGGLSRLQYLDTKIYLPDDILVKVDRMSMANSLETRAPLLDYQVAEFAAGIPAALQRKDGKGKYVLRKLAARFLPPEILAKKKQGFAIPREVWFRGALRDYARDTLTSARFRQRGIFRPERVERILAEHAAGKRDYGMWIWCMINFELWSQAFLDAETRKI
jgi:asparagine synthase (glutamine-hydrolysing)